MFPTTFVGLSASFCAATARASSRRPRAREIYSCVERLNSRLPPAPSIVDRRIDELSAMSPLRLDSHRELIFTTDMTPPPADYAILSHT